MIKKFLVHGSLPDNRESIQVQFYDKYHNLKRIIHKVLHHHLVRF